MVKKSIVSIFIFIFSLVFLHSAGTQVIENPETPLANNAGRLIKITEILRIIDNGRDYFFKRPSRLTIGPDGSLYLTDKNQFLKFDKQGKFISNMQKTGEGPGEYNSLLNFKVKDDHIIIITSHPHKLLINNFSGKLIKEKRLNQSTGYKRVLGIFDDKYYFFHAKLDINEIKSGFQVLALNLFVSTFEDQITDLKLALPQRQFSEKKSLKDGGIAIRMVTLDNFSYTLENEHSLYLTHTSQYMIKHVDTATGKIIGQFNRKYKPVPYVAPKPEENAHTMEGFSKEFFSDITGIALYKDKIWVFTSTVDQKKGVLVDLFSKEGKYLDNFYLPLPKIERPDTLESISFTIDGDFLYIVEPDEDENPTIVKYKIEL